MSTTVTDAVAGRATKAASKPSEARSRTDLYQAVRVATTRPRRQSVRPVSAVSRTFHRRRAGVRIGPLVLSACARARSGAMLGDGGEGVLVEDCDVRPVDLDQSRFAQFPEL